MKRIYFIVPYPVGEAPSQRFRFEFFLPELKKQNIPYKVSPFFTPRYWRILYAQGHYIQKIFGTLSGYLRRILDLMRVINYDFVFIHREATPLGPPVIEWVLAKILRKKIIYDFDDAIWRKDVAGENKLISILKNPAKVSKICKWSYKVSAGNSYLAAYAKTYNQYSFVIPTIVDTENYHCKLKNQQSEKVNIGWTGSNTTLKYLDIIIPVIKELEQTYDFNFVVIANKNPELPLKSFQFIPWRKETEIEDLLRFNIGIMPLHLDEWEKGKCGFKAIQYMSLGIPAIVTAIGVNTEIVQSGINGYLIYHQNEWKEKITHLLENERTRTEMAKEARKTIEERYSVFSTKQIFMKLFNK